MVGRSAPRADPPRAQAAALAAMHGDYHMAHLDIKPANILFQAKQNKASKS